jgi:hypothetical protein
MTVVSAPRNLEAELHDAMSDCATDPLGFVELAYPWGRPGPLEAYDGPDVWQREILEEIGRQVRAHAFDGVRAVLPIRIAVSSGRGVGKGALTGWLVNWIMSTRRNAIGTVTANTNDQLEEKTWAQIRKWTKLCITSHWFEINSAVLYRKGLRESWKCTPASCAPENAEAFQGQHNANSTSFMIFDEASGISDEIFKAAEGGMTDGEPMIFLFFNPTKNTGYAYRAVFGDGSARWTTRIVDARTCKMPNQAFIAEWLEDCGGDEDADFFKVHVRGLPPSASEVQYIDEPRIQGAQRRLVDPLSDDALVMGVDVSGGGSAWTVGRYRRGLDARSLKPIRISGEKSRDRNHVINVLAEALAETHPDRRLKAMFIDSAFGSPIVERLHVLGYKHVHEVNFGNNNTPDHTMANMRAYMWSRGKEWLLRGGIAKDDLWLARDLAAPGYHLNNRNQLVLESKESMIKRGERSPDDGDALMLTFASVVRPDGLQRRQQQHVQQYVPTEWAGG